MKAAVLAVLALAGLLVMHGLSAHHHPTPTVMVEPASEHAAMAMDIPEPTEHDGYSITELCFAVLTGLVGLLWLAIGARRLGGGAASVRIVARHVVRFATARASPPKPLSLSALCVLRT